MEAHFSHAKRVRNSAISVVALSEVTRVMACGFPFSEPWLSIFVVSLLQLFSISSNLMITFSLVPIRLLISSAKGTNGTDNSM